VIAQKALRVTDLQSMFLVHSLLMLWRWKSGTIQDFLRTIEMYAATIHAGMVEYAIQVEADL